MIIRTFFWWWEKQTIQNDNPWFIEELNNSWDSILNQTNNKSNETINSEISIPETSDSTDVYTEIKVMMPKYFYTSWWKNFAEDLYNNQKIYIKFIFIDDLNSYRKILSDSRFSEADLFLFPYDRNEIINIRPFSSEKNMQWFFDELISPIIDSKETRFLPFSADPMIMYSSIDIDENNFSNIANLIYTRESRIQLAFPIFFGILDEDYDKWFPREYQDITRYALIHYFSKYQDSNSLSTRINTNILKESKEFKTYNLENLQTISKTITQSECKYFPSICFQLYNFVWIRFWFLSDKDIVQQYFSHKKSNFEKISKNTMPFFSLESPVRIRWRWISKNLEDISTINAVYKFLIQYMNEHNKYNLRSSTLSVFKKEWDSLLNNQYIWTRWYILERWWDYIETLRKTEAFRQLIEYQISAKDYLKTL